MSDKLREVINRDSYTKEWRMKTAICLLALGMAEDSIESAITGNVNRFECQNICEAQNLNFKKVWDLIK